MNADFDPYLNWLGIRESNRPINHYRLLGVELFESDANVIAGAADRQMAHLRSFQAGPHGELVQKLLNELSAAKICLLKPERKAPYDAQLRAKLAPPKPAVQAAAATTPQSIAVNFTGVTSPAAKPNKLPVRPKSRMLPWAILAGLLVLCGIMIAILINNNKPGPEAIAAEDPIPTKTSKSGKNDETQLTSSKTPSAGVENPAPETSTAAKTAPSGISDAPKKNPPAKTKKPPTDPTPVTVKTPTPPAHDPKMAQLIHKTSDMLVAQIADNAAHALGEELPKTVPADPKVPMGSAPPMPAAPALPDKAAIMAKVKEIRDIFKDEYASRKPDERIALAKKLHKSSQEQQGDQLTKQVLLQEARDIAIQVGEIDVALQSTKQLAAEFHEDLGEAMVAAFSRLVTVSGKNAAYYQQLLAQAAPVVTDLQTKDEYDAALKLVNISQALARRLNDTTSVNQLTTLIKELTQVKTQFAKAKTARESLKTDPQDAAANQVWGEFLCFVKNDFEAGLKHLAKGSDADLKALASRDLAKPQETEKILGLGDEWWAASEREKDRVRAAMRGRAIMYYEKIKGKLTGLAATKVEKRITDGTAEVSTLTGRNFDVEFRKALLATPWTITWSKGSKDVIKFNPNGTSENHLYIVWELVNGELTVYSAPKNQNPICFLKIKQVNGQFQAYTEDVGGRTDTGIALPNPPIK